MKLEGGRKRLPMIEAILDAEIPVMGHLGLTPQSLHAMGGFKVQGREHGAALELVADAKALAAAGCFAIVLEGVPDEVARMVTDAVDVPTIGIGAGAGTDGQVLVYHDVLGIEDRILPKFVRRYADLKAAGVDALVGLRRRRALGRLPRRGRDLPPHRRGGGDPGPLRSGPHRRLRHHVGVTYADRRLRAPAGGHRRADRRRPGGDRLAPCGRPQRSRPDPALGLPSAETPAPGDPDRVPLDGFEEVAITVDPGDGGATWPPACSPRSPASSAAAASWR